MITIKHVNEWPVDKRPFNVTLVILSEALRNVGRSISLSGDFVVRLDRVRSEQLFIHA